MNFEISYNLVYLKEVFKYVLLPVSILILIVLAALFIYSRKEKDHESEQYIYIINLWTYLVCIVLSASLFAVVLSFAISFHHSVTEHGITHPIITIIYLTPLVPLAFLLSTSMRLTEIFVNHKRYKKNSIQNNVPVSQEVISENNTIPSVDTNVNDVNNVNQNEIPVAIPPIPETEPEEMESATENVSDNIEPPKEDSVESIEEVNNEEEPEFVSFDSIQPVDNREDDMVEVPPVVESPMEEEPKIEEKTEELLETDTPETPKTEEAEENTEVASEENTEVKSEDTNSVLLAEDTNSEVKEEDESAEVLTNDNEENTEVLADEEEKENKPIVATMTNKEKYELKQKNLNKIESDNTDDDLEVL